MNSDMAKVLIALHIAFFIVVIIGIYELLSYIFNHISINWV